jgi:putative spermidine/putrescine transport system permease protein
MSGDHTDAATGIPGEPSTPVHKKEAASRSPRAHLGGNPVARRTAIKLGALALKGSAAITLAYILTPLVFVIWLAFFRQEIPSFPPEGYSLRWFAAIADNDRFVSGFLLSLELAVIATATGLCLGLPAALCLSRFHFGGREALNSLLLLPLVVPGIVLGIALYVFDVEAEIATGLPIVGSLVGLIAGHVLIVIPWTVRLVMASLAGLDRSIEEAAQSLGADRVTTFRRVTLPAIRPGVVAAALFGFVSSFGNLEMSLFLVGPGRTTLPIAIIQYLEWKIDPTIAAVSVMQILLIAAAMLITDRFVRISRVV